MIIVAKETLNKTELQVMKHLWKLEKAFLKDIVAAYSEPRPAYTTIATLINRMVKKGYIGFQKMGRDKHYYPILQKNNYFNREVKSMVQDFFNNSSAQFASFFTKNSDLNLDELEALQALLQSKIDQKKEEK